MPGPSTPEQTPLPVRIQQLLTEGLEQQLRQLPQNLVNSGEDELQQTPRLLARHLAGQQSHGPGVLTR